MSRLKKGVESDTVPIESEISVKKSFIFGKDGTHKLEGEANNEYQFVIEYVPPNEEKQQRGYWSIKNTMESENPLVLYFRTKVDLLKSEQSQQWRLIKDQQIRIATTTYEI